MKRSFINRILLIFFCMLIVSSMAHALILPQQTRAMLVGYYDFEQEGTVYFRADVDTDTQALLQQYVARGTEEVSTLFGEAIPAPTIIYCATDADFDAFGSLGPSPAVTHMHLSAQVVVNASGLHPDVIAHEMAHAALYEQVGMLRNQFELPYWFHEGLAMQVDYRESYGEAWLRAQTDDLQQLPNVRQLSTPAVFFTSDYRLHYAAARYEVSQWYSPARLQQFIADIRAGSSFDEAYDKQY